MGDLSANFFRREFSCCGSETNGGHPGKRCNNDTVDAELILILEDVRQHFRGNHIIITSGCRCPIHNHHEGGADGSYHLLGKGADFRINNVLDDNVADYLEQRYTDKYGIGRYDRRTHIDSRPYKARWDKRS